MNRLLAIARKELLQLRRDRVRRRLQLRQGADAL